MNATMGTAVPSVPSVPSRPPNHPAIPDSSLVRALKPCPNGGDDGSALRAHAQLGREAALRATAAAEFAVEAIVK